MDLLDEKNEFLILLSQNKTYDIVEKLFETMFYDEKEKFLNNYNLVFNFLENFSLENKEKFAKLLSNHFPHSKEMNLEEIDPHHYKKIKKFWKLKKEKNIPLICAFIPYLEDKDIANILSENTFCFSTYQLKNETIENIVLRLLDFKYIDTLMFLQKEYQIDYKIDIYKNKKLKELLEKKGKEHIELIPFISRVFYQNYFEYLENIILDKMENKQCLSKEENELFQAEIVKNYSKIYKEDHVEYFEKLLSTLTYASGDLQTTKRWIEKNFPQYQGKSFPLWALGHPNAEIVTYQMKEDVDLFEYNEKLNKFFLVNLTRLKKHENDKSLLEIIHYSKKEWIEKLLSEKKVNDQSRKLYTILLASETDYILNKSLLINLDDYTNYLYNQVYEELNQEKKDEAIISYVNNFLFQETLKSKENKKEWNISNIFYKFYTSQEEGILTILLNHLKILGKNKQENSEYINEYKEVFTKLIKNYSFKVDNVENKRYELSMAIIDYMLPFPSVIDDLHQLCSSINKEDYSDLSKKVFHLVEFIYLNNHVKNEKIIEKKLKI